MSSTSFDTLPSDEFLTQALQEASLNALRVALYHETQDADLAAIPVMRRNARGGALTSFSIDKEFHDLIKQKAMTYFKSAQKPKPSPTKAQAAGLMGLFAGQAISDIEVDYGYEELAFEKFPRLSHWNKKPTNDELAKNEVIIIGSGFSGLAAAVQLKQLGLPYRIIERHPDIGGTWFVNDYPDARVDVSTFLYQYKFEKNYPWKSYYADQRELKNYIDHIADAYEIRPHIELDTELLSATWDETRSMWDLAVKRTDGSTETLTSKFVISATGLFRTAKLPNIKGIESFQGDMFHTTEWDHDCDLADKAVAVIGTGSTGSQLVPKIAETTKQLTIYQRTANWVTPVKEYKAEVSPEKRWLLDNMPGYVNWFIYASYVAELPAQQLQVMDPEWVDSGGRVNAKNAELEEGLKSYIRCKVGDRDDLYEKLVPKHPPLARRLVIDNGWYDTLIKDNVELVAGGINEITSNGIIGADGVERPCDIIVLSAGFEVSEFLWPVDYTGRDGATLEELWNRDGARAYKGMTLPGFPNFFMFYGPNAQARAGSFHSWVENLSRYIGGVIVATIEADGHSVEVRDREFELYNMKMDQALKSILWEAEGIGGYYLNKQGRSHINMPWTAHEFYQMIQTPDISAYKID